MSSADAIATPSAKISAASAAVALSAPAALAPSAASPVDEALTLLDHNKTREKIITSLFSDPKVFMGGHIFNVRTPVDKKLLLIPIRCIAQFRSDPNSYTERKTGKLKEVEKLTIVLYSDLQRPGYLSGIAEGMQTIVDLFTRSHSISEDMSLPTNWKRIDKWVRVKLNDDGRGPVFRERRFTNFTTIEVVDDKGKTIKINTRAEFTTFVLNKRFSVVAQLEPRFFVKEGKLFVSLSAYKLTLTHVGVPIDVEREDEYEVIDDADI